MYPRNINQLNNYLNDNNNKILLFLSVKGNQGLLKSIQLIKQQQQQ